MSKIIMMIGILVLLLTMTSSAYASNVCRSIPSGSQMANVDIPISLTVTVDDATYYVIDEIIPDGLTITDPGTGDTTESGHLKWIVTTDATDTVYTYKVQGLGGPYFLYGWFQIEGMLDYSLINGDTNLEILCNWRDEWMGILSDDGAKVTTTELQDAISHWLDNKPVRNCHVMTLADIQEIIDAWLSS